MQKIQKTAQNAQEVLGAVSQFELSNLLISSKLFSKVKLTQTARLVLIALVSHYPKIRVYIKTLCEETGAGKTAVETALTQLSKEGLILVTLTGRSSIFELTIKFFNLLKSDHHQTEKEEITSSDSGHPHNKHENINNKKNNSVFKNLINLSKTDTIKYYDQVQTLEPDQQEKLLKIKLNRTYLTDFQKRNTDKLIMLTDSEINNIFTKIEGYVWQENVDIKYKNRISRINKYLEQEASQEEAKNKEHEDPRKSILAMLKAGYSIKKNEKLKQKYLESHKEAMEKHNITEEELKKI